MVAWRSARSWRARGWIRVAAVALPVLFLPVAAWPTLLGTSVEADPPLSRTVVLVVTYLGFAVAAWVVFRLRISVVRGTVRVTNVGRTSEFPADDVVRLEPTARGVRFVIKGRDPVIGYAVPCPPPDPGRRPRWLGVAEAVAGEDPARVAIIRGRSVAPGVRSTTADARTTAYRFTGQGLGPEAAVCRRALALMRPRLHQVFVTTGPTDDWPAALRAEVAASTTSPPVRRTRQRGRSARPDGRTWDLALDLSLDPTGAGTFALLLRLAPWVVALEATSLRGTPAGAVFDRCRDARLLLTDHEHEDLLAAIADSGLDPHVLVVDVPRGS